MEGGHCPPVSNNLIWKINKSVTYSEMVATPTKLLTLAEFREEPEIQPAREYVEEKVSQKPMPQGKHSLLQIKLVIVLNSFLMEKRIAVAFSELRCTFGGRSIVPDLAIVQQGKIPLDEQGEIANAFNIAPDWMIEILSPDQSATKVIKKILHCLQHGTEVGWLIDPAEKSIFIYHSEKQIEVVDDQDQELLVPGFAESVKLTASDIFSWLKLS
jgi:Uma2 family endonuclease